MPAELAAKAPAAMALQALQHATLDTSTGSQTVLLPHSLASADVPPAGGTVRYHLEWQLPAIPDRPQAVYVAKMALSGRLFVNGQLVGACGYAPLEVLRCLHQPQLFRVPAALFREGLNTLEFEIYATARQMNGLSVVRVGDADALYTQFYVWRKWLTADLHTSLSWLSILLGLLSLMVGLILRRKTVFLWFGLASVVNAVASMNGFVIHPWIDIDLYNWLIFSSRLVSVPLTFLTLLGIFAKDGGRIARLLLVYSVLAPAVVWLSGNHRTAVFALYAPFVVACPFFLYSAFRWSWRSRDPFHAITALMMLAFFGGGALDWIRLAGGGPFDGIYFSAYLYSGMMFAMGLVLVGRLAHALVQSQTMRALLERKVAERMAYEVTEHIPVGTYTMVLQAGETTAHFSFMSRRFLEMIGLERDVLARDPFRVFDCLHPEDRKAWIQRNVEAFTQKAPLLGHIRIVRDGVVRWVITEAIPRALPGGATLWEGVLIDDTDRVLAMESAEKGRAALQAHLLEQSRLQEREQLLRDMHDGFGSQLASVRMMVEKGRIPSSALASYLQEVSADLHLVVDTLGQSNITLEEAIYNKRYRIERRFAGSGIQFDWHVALEALPPLSPRTILQILRIVQEAMHNAIRHADPKHIALTAVYQPGEDQLLVRIQDDGTGMPEQPRHGRGLDNMRNRSREIGAQWRMDPGAPGTIIELRFTHPGSAGG
ncbi:MAG: hypothetical protein PHI55_01890 [Burkholderiaceae bacterium]|nr:hypothetical protein [Burkholderiaceae bacterium]